MMMMMMIRHDNMVRDDVRVVADPIQNELSDDKKSCRTYRQQKWISFTLDDKDVDFLCRKK